MLGTEATTAWYCQYHSVVVSVLQCGTCAVPYIDDRENGVAAGLKCCWDEENRVLAADESGFVFNYCKGSNGYVDGESFRCNEGAWEPYRSKLLLQTWVKKDANISPYVYCHDNLV